MSDRTIKLNLIETIKLQSKFDDKQIIIEKEHNFD